MNPVETLFKHIQNEYEQIFGVKPLKDMDEAELKTFVSKQCDKHALNVLLGSEPNSLVDTSTELSIKSRQPLRNLEEVKEILNYSVNAYLREKETEISNLKNDLYKRIRNYQIEREASHW
jgi:hypothetical protein